MRHCFTPRAQISGRAPRSRTRGRTLILSGAGMLAASAFGLSPHAAVAAATVVSTVGVTSTIEATCTTTTTPLAFGVYTAAEVVQATADVTVTCTNTTPYVIGLNAGLGSGASVTTRGMTGPGTLLHYGLYSDSGRTLNWGADAEGGAQAGIATGLPIPLTIYGKEPLGQLLTPGDYTDTITATVTY